MLVSISYTVNGNFVLEW